MRKNIITVSREFGSGGRSVAKAVAERLGFDYYDQEIIMRVAEESGLAKDVVAEYDEYMSHKNSLLFTLSQSGGGSLYGALSFANMVQMAQTKVIKRLAEKGNCVIVGRASDYILRDREDCLHVFVYANKAFRADRIVNVYGETDKKIENRIKDMDKRRKLYYSSFTGREWGFCHNYHLSLDSSVLGIEGCADMIIKAVETAQ